MKRNEAGCWNFADANVDVNDVKTDGKLFDSWMLNVGCMCVIEHLWRAKI